MITVFPALASSTIKPNALPGIGKALEKFVVVYRMDGIIGAASSFQLGGKVRTLLAGTRYETLDHILSEAEKLGPRTKRDQEEYKKMLLRKAPEEPEWKEKEKFKHGL